MIVKGVRAISKFLAVVTLLSLSFQGLAGATPPCSACGLLHVPELDPYTIGAGLTVFVAASALLIERYRRGR
jgi:hypothetical protein